MAPKINSHISSNEEIINEKDKVLKAIFSGEDGIYLLETLMKDILGKEVKIKKSQDEKIPIVEYDEIYRKIKVFVDNEERKTFIELSVEFSEYARDRNFFYFIETMIDIQENDGNLFDDNKYIEITLSSGVEREEKLVDNYMFRNEDNEELLDNMVIYVANLDNAKESYYNGDKSNLVKHLAIFKMTRSEIEKNKKDDKFMAIIAQKLSELNADEEWFWNDSDEYQRLLQIAYWDGFWKVKIECAQRMLLDNIPIEKISLYTDLTKEEIEKIKEELEND